MSSHRPNAVIRFFGLSIALVLAMAAVLQLWSYGLRMPGIDFYQFWVVGTELKHGDVAHIYSHETREALGAKWIRDSSSDRSSRLYAAARRRPQLETFSTPLLYSVFALISSGDYELDYQCYLIGSFAILIAAIVGLCRSLGTSATVTALWIAFFFGCFQPLRSDVAVGNVNQLQVGGLALYIWLQRHGAGRLNYLAGGAVLGLMMAFKPNLGMAIGLLVLSWIITGIWSKLFWQGVGAGLAVIIAVAGSSLLFGSSDCWVEWLGSLKELITTQSLPVEAGNFSLAALLQHSGAGNHSKVLLMGVSLCAVIVVGLMSWSWNASTAPAACHRDLFVIGIGTAAMLLGSRLAWLHYFELLIPAVIYCVSIALVNREHFATRWANQLLAFAALVLIALIPINWVVGFKHLAVPALLCLVGVVLLTILLIREFRGSRATV